MKPEHQILHRKFQQYGANAKEWMRKCVLLLPEIEKHQVWRAKGFASIYEYAAKLAGMSRNTVDDALRILKRIEDKPELIKIVEDKGLNAVRPVVTIATPATESFWAEKAKNMSRHTLETYIKEFRKTFFGEDSATDMENLSVNATTGSDLTKAENSTETVSRTGTGNNGKNSHQQAISILGNFIAYKKIVAMELDPEVVEQLEKLKGQDDWNELMKQFLQMRAQQLEEQKPEAVTAKSRHIPNKIQRYIFQRTNGTCSYPCCKKPFKIKHHTQRFALEEVHDPDRLHGLCKAHERIAHLGLIENEEGAPPFWKAKKEPDRAAPKFKIDQLVAKYRL